MKLTETGSPVTQNSSSTRPNSTTQLTYMRRKQIKFPKHCVLFVILDDGQLQKPSNSKVSVKKTPSKPLKKFHTVWPIR